MMIMNNYSNEDDGFVMIMIVYIDDEDDGFVMIIIVYN